MNDPVATIAFLAAFYVCVVVLKTSEQKRMARKIERLKAEIERLKGNG